MKSTISSNEGTVLFSIYKRTTPFTIWTSYNAGNPYPANLGGLFSSPSTTSSNVTVDGSNTPQNLLNLTSFTFGSGPTVNYDSNAKLTFLD